MLTNINGLIFLIRTYNHLVYERFNTGHSYALLFRCEGVHR